MTDQEKQALAKQIGDETATKLKTLSDSVDKTSKEIAEKAADEKTKGFISKTDFDDYQEKTKLLVDEVKEIARKQGVAIGEMKLTATQQNEAKKFGVGEFLSRNGETLKAIKNKTGNKQYLDFMITADKSGSFHAQEIMREDNGTIKTVGPHATVDGVAGAGNVAAGNVGSIYQSISASAILRSVTDATINEQYRNNTWLFSSLGLEQVGMENRVAFYFDEQPKTGGSAIVPEGTAKPYVQYGAILRSADYRKRAVAMEFTDEFQFDFQFLQTYFLQKGRIDLYNDINADVYSRLLAAGTAYASADAANFKLANGGPLANINNYDVIVAMAAKVNKNTFGANANASIMSTEKAAANTIQKDLQGRYIGLPTYIENMNMIENPAIGIDDIITGDLSQYKLQMRGGIIVRAGLNGNNLIENKMTYVMEQYYFDYISPLRQPAILKGQTFAAVKALLTAA